MENRFVITKGEKRGIIFRLYLNVLGLVAIGIATALLFAYVPKFSHWFFAPESTPQKPLGGFWAWIIFLLPLYISYLYFTFSSMLGNNSKMNIAFLLAILMGGRTAICFYGSGWKETSIFLAIALGLFSLAVWMAVFIKRDFSKYKKICVAVSIVLMIIVIIRQLMSDYDNLDSAIFYAISILGCFWVFLDVQDLWFKLEDVHDQWNLDNMCYHILINLLIGFWLIHIFADFFRLMTKFWTNGYQTSQKRNLPNA